MPRRGASGIKGVYKKHNAQCTNSGDPTRCDCAWWGRYKAIRRSLAQWSGQAVDPVQKAHAITVFNRLKVAIDSRQYSPRGERESLGSRQTLKQFIAEWCEHYAKASFISMGRI